VVPEASFEQTEAGAVPATPGWFVLNARDARWGYTPGMGHGLPLTGIDEDEAETLFPMLGMAIRVMNPGEPSTTYHWETEQEDFLVLAGEAILLIEGEERPVRQWDFVHCPPKARHAFVGAWHRSVRTAVRQLSPVSEGRAVGLLLLRPDRRALQRQFA
jgi:hypothetical protein